MAARDGGRKEDELQTLGYCAVLAYGRLLWSFAQE